MDLKEITQKALKNKQSFNIVCSILKNIQNHPSEPKLRILKLSNPKVANTLKHEGCTEILLYAGFKKEKERLIFPPDSPIDYLKATLSEITRISQDKTDDIIIQNVLKNDESFKSAIKMTNLLNANEKFKRNKDDPEANVELASAIDEMSVQKELPRAIALCQRAIELENKQTNARPIILFRANLIHASCLYKLKQIPQACIQIKNCEPYLQLVDKRNQSEYHCLMGCIHVARQEPEPAIQHFDQAISLNPSNKEHLVYQRCNAVANKAMFEGLVLGKTNECIDILNECIAQCPGHEVSLMSLGMVYQRMGDVENAIKYFTELVHRPARDYDAVKMTRQIGFQQLCILLQKENRLDELAKIEEYWKKNPK